MRHEPHNDDPVLITNAQPSFDEEQRHRKHVYAALMVVHLLGFIAAALLANIWWLAVGIIIVTGTLPWAAVVLANDQTSKHGQSRRRHPRYPTLEDRHHDHIDI